MSLNKHSEDEFYSQSVIELRILNRFTYKGKGRPRKTDYITIKEAMNQVVIVHNMFLNTMYVPR